MATNRFSALEITLDDCDFVFRDDGIVPDAAKHGQKVLRELRPTERKGSIHIEDRGATIIGEIDGQITAIIFYDQLSPLLRGHEETHVIHVFGYLPLLNQRMLHKGIGIDLWKYSRYERCTPDERELVAYLGGLYALENSGVPIRGYRPKYAQPELRTALEMYQGADRKRYVTKPSAKSR